MTDLPKNHRLKKTTINVVTDIVAYFIITILRFVVRSAFIVTLGTEVLGLNQLFASVISIFSLAELGFGMAMGSMLYGPVAVNDTEKIKSIINLTKKIFVIVGILVFIGGLAVTPFINFFIEKPVLPLKEIQFYFILYATFSMISYFNVHKSVLINADQKRYIEKNISTFFNASISIVQIVLLLTLKSFTLFLVTQIIFTIVQNIVLSITANKLYPYLKDKNCKPLDKNEVKDLLKKTIALLSYKIGAVVVAATDTLLISKFLGAGTTGAFSNYTLVFTSISILIYQFVNGSIASVGNLWKTDSPDKIIDIFKKMQFMQFWLSSFSTVCLVVLTEPFITLWLKEDAALLGLPMVIVLSINFYLTTMRSIVNIFKDANGMFWYDKYKPLFEAGINFGVSLLLVKYLGILGVILGTTVSIVSVLIWVEPYVLYKYGFKKKTASYFLDYFFKFLLTAGITVLTYFICSFLGDGIAMFIAKMAICCIVPNLILFCIFFKSKEFKFFVNILLTKLKRKPK